MRSGVWSAVTAFVVLASTACTQEIQLPVATASSVDDPATDASTRRRDARTGTAGAPDAEDELPDAGSEDAGEDRDAAPDANPRGCKSLDPPVRALNPRVVIALDRSASMFRKPTGGGKPITEWARSGLRGLLGTYENVIHFGYEEFPISGDAPECGGAMCCASDVVVQPQASPLPAMEARWACGSDQPNWCAKTSSESPSYEALGRIRAMFKNDDGDPVQRYILLLTDHDPWCAGLTTKQACHQTIERVADMRNFFPYIKTAVFGLSTTVSDSLCLSEMAHQGGFSRDTTSFPGHFVTLDETEFTKRLGEQLATIARGACVYSLEQFLGGSHLSITIEGETIPRDDVNGWSPLSGSIIRFNGTSCDRLLGDSMAAVDVQQCRR
jgi:hypothetical protein